ncbi:MAG: menaquinone-dependent protoporphyrinogen oxidase [Gaiellales bacterium]|jgi:menaquinone-dependent protoporphyrinogen oxidase|nr:menaquinone-dependent protoporphyrinogen oxidase [Gaiellales bacterium]
MNVLVAAASRHGATQEIADAIGITLNAEGMSASVVPIAEVADLAGYEAFVLGSAVYMGRWLDSAKTFVERNSETLSNQPTWLFSSGPIGDPPRPKQPEAVDVDDVVSKTHANEHKLFAGKLDKNALGFGERAVMLAFRAVEGDYRDWDEIQAWARAVAQELRR